MKYCLQFSEQRDRDLLQAFLRQRSNSFWRRVYDAVHSPSACYWVTPETAAKDLKAYCRQDAKCKRWRTLRMQRAKDIYDACDGDFSMERIEYVVYSPAPRFYLSVWSAYRYILRAMEKRKKDRGWK